MNKYKSYGKGWHYESHRHSLAAKGIKTSFASENAYMNLLDSINKIYPEHDPDEQFELFGDWNRDYLTGSKAYGSLSFAAKVKMKISDMSFEDFKRAAEHGSLTEEQKEAMKEAMASNETLRVMVAGEPILMGEGDFIQPVDPSGGALWKAEQVRREGRSLMPEMSEQQERKIERLIDLKQDYIKRLSERRKLTERKLTFEEEEVPDRLKLVNIKRLDDAIRELDAEVGSAKGEELKSIAEEIYPGESGLKIMPYGGRKGLGYLKEEFRERVMPEAKQVRRKAEELRALAMRKIKPQPEISISPEVREESKKFAEEKYANYEPSVKPWGKHESV